MHLHTVIKLKAVDEEDAIDIANGLMESGFVGNGYDASPNNTFDWWDEEATHIDEECKTEADFLKLREAELEEGHKWLEKANEEVDFETKGSFLKWAGGAFNSDDLWAAERYAYDHTRYQDDIEEASRIFYVHTDRHL